MIYSLQMQLLNNNFKANLTRNISSVN